MLNRCISLARSLKEIRIFEDSDVSIKTRFLANLVFLGTFRNWKLMTFHAEVSNSLALSLHLLSNAHQFWCLGQNMLLFGIFSNSSQIEWCFASWRPDSFNLENCPTFLSNRYKGTTYRERFLKELLTIERKSSLYSKKLLWLSLIRTFVLHFFANSSTVYKLRDIDFQNRFNMFKKSA